MIIHFQKIADNAINVNKVKREKEHDLLWPMLHWKMLLGSEPIYFQSSRLLINLALTGLNALNLLVMNLNRPRK